MMEAPETVLVLPVVGTQIVLGIQIVIATEKEIANVSVNATATVANGIRIRLVILVYLATRTGKHP